MLIFVSIFFIEREWRDFAESRLQLLAQDQATVASHRVARRLRDRRLQGLQSRARVADRRDDGETELIKGGWQVPAARTRRVNERTSGRPDERRGA